MPYIGTVDTSKRSPGRSISHVLQMLGLLLLWLLSDLAARLLLQRLRPDYFVPRAEGLRPLPTPDGEPIVLLMSAGFILLLCLVLVLGQPFAGSRIAGLPQDDLGHIAPARQQVSFGLPPQASQLTIGLLLGFGFYAIVLFAQDLIAFVFIEEPAWLGDYLDLAKLIDGISLSPFFSQTAGPAAEGFSWPTAQLDPGSARYPWLLAAYVLAAPAAEELLVRGLILPHCKQLMKPGQAVVLTSALFALLYPEPQQALTLFILGLIWGWSAESSGTLLPNLLTRPLLNLLLLLPPAWFHGWPGLQQLLTVLLVLSFILAFAWLIRLAVGPMARTHGEPLGSKTKAADVAGKKTRI